MKITSIGKAKALAALFNAGLKNSRVLSMMAAVEGQQIFDRLRMSEERAKATLYGRGGNLYFDYLDNVCIKCDFGTDEISLRLFDRDNGHGAGEAALRAAGCTGE